MVQEVELEVNHLSSFLAYLKRAPNVGGIIRSLKFSTFLSKEEGDDPFGSWAIGGLGSLDDLDSMLNFNPLKGMKNLGREVDTWNNHLIETESKALVPLDRLFCRAALTWRNSKVQGVHVQNCSIARGLILDQASNLKSLEISGNTAFSFCKYAKNTDLIPLKGLSNLKEIKITAHEWEQENYLSGSNVVWILAFLPHLKKASFSPVITEKDRHYLEEHQEVLRVGVSKVQELSLNVKLAVYADYRTSTLVLLLSTVRELVKLRVTNKTVIGAEEMDSELMASETLALFKSSRAPYKEIHREDDVFSSLLFSYSNLKVLSTDINLINQLLDLVFQTFNEGKKPEILPSGLEVLKLSSNGCMSKHVKSDEPLESMVFLFGENQLSFLLEQITLPKALTIVTYTGYVGSKEVVQSPNIKKSFTICRERLEKTCLVLGVDLILVDDVAEEDVWPEPEEVSHSSLLWSKKY